MHNKGGQETREWGTGTLGDLWKEEGWGGEHGVNEMDTTGTSRTLHDRELSGRKAGNLKEVGLGWNIGVEKIVLLDGGK